MNVITTSALTSWLNVIYSHSCTIAQELCNKLQLPTYTGRHTKIPTSAISCTHLQHLDTTRELAIIANSSHLCSVSQDMTLAESSEQSLPQTLLKPQDDVLLQPSVSQKKSRNQRKCDKVNKRPTLICFANNLQGEISQGVYVQTGKDDKDDFDYTELKDPIADEYELDDLCYSNWKKGCQFCRSVSKRAKPNIKPHGRVKTASRNKSAKTIRSNLNNYSAQKDNIQDRLDRLKIKRFGYDIYYKRSEPTLPATPRNSKVQSRKIRNRQPDNTVDHPNALKYELKKDSAAKGDNQMNKIVDLQHRDITPEDYELLLMLDDSVAPKTVSTNFLATLKVVVVNEADLLGGQCAICMEVYQESEQAKELPCSHFFHVNCIDNWLCYASPNCPLDGVPVEA